MKYKIFASSLLVLSVFAGCSDSSEDKVAKDASITSDSSPKIEVVKSDNAREIKVEEKAKKGDRGHQGNAYYYDYNVKSEYDPNSQPANQDASVRIKPRSNIDANMHVRSPYEEIQVSLMVRKLSKKFIIKCSACHNDYANGIIGPSLLGKDADFIFNKIADFKSGKKSNPLMNDLINMMDEKEIKEMANEVYKFNQEIKQMRNK